MDEVTRLRSIAKVPDGSESSFRADWERDIQDLTWDDFSQLMEPLLTDNRAALIALPEWSRQILFERFLRQG